MEKKVKTPKKPVIKITKIIPPAEKSVLNCHVSEHGDIECWFTVNGVKYVLHYNPKLAGYDGMPAEAHEHCSFCRECDGKVFNCTTLYAIPNMPKVAAYGTYTWEYFGKNAAVDSFMHPTEKMLLNTFIKPFVNDYDIASYSANPDSEAVWASLSAKEKDALIAAYKAMKAIAE
jgi:hypothetical protein